MQGLSEGKSGQTEEDGLLEDKRSPGKLLMASEASSLLRISERASPDLADILRCLREGKTIDKQT